MFAHHFDHCGLPGASSLPLIQLVVVCFVCALTVELDVVGCALNVLATPRRGRAVIILVAASDSTQPAQTIDAQGWLHTGDIGQWNDDGSLSIIDRKKNIFKLSQGEYVAPDSIEASLQTSKWISQIFVYGNSLEFCTVAVVVPDKDSLLPWASSKGIKGTTLAEVVANPQAKMMIFEDMKECGKRMGVKGYEMPKDVHLEGTINALGQGFNIDNDCLTPTLKVK